MTRSEPRTSESEATILPTVPRQLSVWQELFCITFHRKYFKSHITLEHTKNCFLFFFSQFFRQKRKTFPLEQMSKWWIKRNLERRLVSSWLAHLKWKTNFCKTRFEPVSGPHMKYSHHSLLSGNNSSFFSKNGPSSASFLFIFVFSNKHYNAYNKNMWKIVHPVYSAGIQTHNHRNMSLLP